MNKEILKTFIVLGLFSLSGGIYYNFQELWMNENGLSITTISIVYSLGALLTVSTIFLCSNLIKQRKIKTFALGLLLLKGVSILSLYFLNGSSLNILIKFLIMFDYVIDVEIFATIYPMITLVAKSDKIYAARGLIYALLYYLGVIFATFSIGKNAGFVSIDYNLHVLIGSVLIFLALIVLATTNLEKYYPKKDSGETGLLFKLFAIVKKDKISLTYFAYTASGAVSYYCLLGLTVLLLTNFFDFSPVASSSINMALGIGSALLGIFILACLNFKNRKISLAIKYVIRVILYLIAFIFNIKILYLIALFYPKVISESYTQVTDAPYINRFEGKYQLAFCNLKEMVSYFGRSIGTLLSGIAMGWGLRYIFMIAFIFSLIQCVISYITLNLYEKEQAA